MAVLPRYTPTGVVAILAIDGKVICVLEIIPARAVEEYEVADSFEKSTSDFLNAHNRRPLIRLVANSLGSSFSCIVMGSAGCRTSRSEEHTSELQSRPH